MNLFHRRAGAAKEGEEEEVVEGNLELALNAEKKVTGLRTAEDVRNKAVWIFGKLGA